MGQYSSTRPRQTCTDSGSHIRYPQPSWSPPLAPFHQSWIYMVGKRHSGKADQSTLASGGSEHAQLFSVAISWGNKMDFSLCANMSGFCSDSHICCLQVMRWWACILPSLAISITKLT